jgi:hypothetical protein
VAGFCGKKKYLVSVGYKCMAMDGQAGETEQSESQYT